MYTIIVVAGSTNEIKHVQAAFYVQLNGKLCVANHGKRKHFMSQKTTNTIYLMAIFS
jgi:hypothetical protein